MADLMREKGISQLGWRAREALRMRVSMSAMGSLMVMACSSPARLGDARDLTGQRQLAEANAAQGEAPNECARAATEPAAAVRLHLEASRTVRFRDHGFFGQCNSSV